MPDTYTVLGQPKQKVHWTVICTYSRSRHFTQTCKGVRRSRRELSTRQLEEIRHGLRNPQQDQP